MFLREYIDRLFAESSKVPKKRDRIRDTVPYDKEQLSPFQAPKWTLSGYNGSLKVAVESACTKRSSKETIPVKDLFVLALTPEQRESSKSKRKSKSKSKSKSRSEDSYSDMSV